MSPGAVRCLWVALIPINSLFQAFWILLLLLWGQTVIAGGQPVSMWRLSANGKDLYLLGSIHALSPDYYPLPRVIDEAFDWAEQVVLEVDISRIDPEATAELTRTLGHYPAGQSLDSQLTPRTLGLVKRYLAARGASLEQVSHVRPWLLGLQIGLAEVQRLGFDPGLGVESYFTQRAMAEGKRIGQLETLAEQLQILAADPPDIQDLSLRVALEEIGGLEQDMSRMMAAWSSGDADLLYLQAIESLNREPVFGPQIDRIIHDRNRTMAAEVRKLAASDTDTLVIVGALHLGGPQGMLALLAKYFQIEQIKDVIKQ